MKSPRYVIGYYDGQELLFFGVERSTVVFSKILKPFTPQSGNAFTPYVFDSLEAVDQILKCPKFLDHINTHYKEVVDRLTICKLRLQSEDIPMERFKQILEAERELEERRENILKRVEKMTQHELETMNKYLRENVD
jgi:hypothetical protein